MTNQADKLKILKSMSEAEFRAEVLVPLLKNMSYEQVRERHGTQEYGKDITFYEKSDFGDIHYAVVAKKGNISGAASGKGNLATIMNQIDQAFTIPYDDVEDKKRFHIDRVIVWTTGKISNNAEAQVMNLAQSRYKYVVFRDGNATLELLEKYYPSFFTIRDPYVSDYFAYLKKHYNRLEELRALGVSDENRRLASIFVPPDFSAFTPSKLKSTNKRRRVYSYDGIRQVTESLIIVGEAGAGKTTLLRRWLLDVIEENEKNGDRTPIPIFVSLRNVDFTLEQALEEAAAIAFSEASRDPVLTDLTSEFEQGNVILFLDGLDEIENDELIEQAVGQVEAFQERYKRMRIVMTSRFLSIFEKQDVLAEFRALQLRELSPTQIVKFLENWYAEQFERARDLVHQIGESDGLHGLPLTPLSLALVAILHEKSPWQELPANQTELFNKYTEMALGRWDTSKGLNIQFEYFIKRYLLQQISWDIHSARELEIHTDNFGHWVERLAEDHGLNLDIDTFRQEIIERSELLYQNGRGNYEFKHRTFRDYFVGVEINRRSDAVHLVTTNVLDPWWAPAIFFATGLQPDNEQYVRAILEQVEAEKHDALNYALTMGRLLQANFMATRGTKKAVVVEIIEKLIDWWGDVYDRYQQLEEKPAIMARIPAQIIFLWFQIGAVQRAIGSITLAPVLADLAKVYARPLPEGSTEEEKIRHEWRVFLLAMAAGRLDDTAKHFVELYESGTIVELSFIFAGHVLAKEVAGNERLKPKLRERAKDLSKKLGKKWSGADAEYLRYIKREEMIALPAPDDDEDDEED